MSGKKRCRDVKTAEELALRRLEGLEPDEGRMGEPAEEEVQFIFMPPWSPDDDEELPRVIKRPNGLTLVIVSTSIPDEYAEEFLAQNPGARFGEE
jgi:hypothetical protein